MSAGGRRRPPLCHLVFVEPEIPNNTGNAGRTCVALASRLHLVHPLGFSLDEKACRRAGLDYWPRLDLREHADWGAYERESVGERRWLFTARGGRCVFDVDLRAGDHLVFGRETRGLDGALLERFPDRCVRLPMAAGERSLNVATAACAAMYELVRQARERGEIGLDADGRILFGDSIVV